jgi:hypothetical protein
LCGHVAFSVAEILRLLGVLLLLRSSVSPGRDPNIIRRSVDEHCIRDNCHIDLGERLEHFDHLYPTNGDVWVSSPSSDLQFEQWLCLLQPSGSGRHCDHLPAILRESLWWAWRIPICFSHHSNHCSEPRPECDSHFCSNCNLTIIRSIWLPNLGPNS